MKAIFLKYILIIIICSTSLLTAKQDESLIEVRSMVDTSVITIGDRILYSIVVDRKKDLNVKRPGEGLNLGGFEIKDYNFHDPEEKGGRIVERWDFNISVYDTGHFVIPSFPIAYAMTDTATRFHLIEASPIDIYVNSVLDKEAQRELKDIKPPLEIPFNYIFWISMIAAGLLVIAIGVLAYLLWKRRKEKGYIFSPPPPPLPPHVRALADLQELFESDLLEKGQLKSYFTSMSDIIRIYLEGRYEILALEETTMEIMRDTGEYLQENELSDILLEILSLADLVKFAKHQPEKEEIEQAGKNCLDFIERTKPIFQIQDDETDGEETALVAQEQNNNGNEIIKTEE